MSEPQSLSEVEGYNPVFPAIVVLAAAALALMFTVGGLYHLLLGNAIIGGIVLGSIILLSGVVARIWVADEN